MKGTVLLAGFGSDETEETARLLLGAGACVLQTPDPAAALVHLAGGAIDAVVISAAMREGSSKLKTRAGKLGLAVLVINPPLAAKDVRRLIETSLRRGDA